MLSFLQQFVDVSEVTNVGDVPGYDVPGYARSASAPRSFFEGPVISSFQAPTRKSEAHRGGDAIVSVYGCFVAPWHEMCRRKQEDFRFKHPAVPRGGSINPGPCLKYEDETPLP